MIHRIDCCLVVALWIAVGFSPFTGASTAVERIRWRLDAELVSSVLSRPVQFDSKEDEEACRQLLQEFSDEEAEIAARTSYVYWYAATVDDECPASTVRENMALREAKRHYVGLGRDYNHTRESLRAAIHFRKERKIDLIRLCFHKQADQYVRDNEEDLKQIRHWESLLEAEVQRQFTVVRGHDRHNRAIVYRSSRTTKDVDVEAYHTMGWYMTERGIACTEVLSAGEQETVVSALDYSRYQADKLPPMNVVRESIQTMQKYYPERTEQVFILDPPLWLRVVYSVILPFLAERSRSKVSIVAGKKSRTKKVAPLVDLSQATPLLLKGGVLRSQVDTSRMLWEVPFHALYDDVGTVADAK